MYLKRQEREVSNPKLSRNDNFMTKKKLSPQGSFDILVGGHRRSDWRNVRDVSPATMS